MLAELETQKNMRVDELHLIQEFENRFRRITGKKCKVIIISFIDALLRKLTLPEILSTVELFRLPTIPSLRSVSRKRELVNLRKIYCLLAKKAGYTATSIGNEIGERDHTTVLYNINTAKHHLKNEVDFQNLYFEVQQKIIELYEDRLNDHV